MEIEIDLTSYSGVVLIPDVSTQISSQDYAIAVPSVVSESNGSYIQRRANYVLKSDFVTHIDALASEPISVTVAKTSGVSKKFTVWAKKLGKSRDGMSAWWINTSNGWRLNLAESALEKPADLNITIEALTLAASDTGFYYGGKERAIIKSINTLHVRKKIKK